MGLSCIGCGALCNGPIDLGGGEVRGGLGLGERGGGEGKVCCL